MKSIKSIIFLIIVLFASLTVFFLNNDEDINKVCFDDNCFVVEVVDTPAEREQGLMFREQLDRNNGMLFIFENQGNYPFWMKNTLVPLDMIWIDIDGKIVDIKEADPCEADPCPIIYPQGNAKYVLEINKGLSAELGIKIGEIAESKFI